MTLRLGGDGAITGCTSLEEPTISISGLTMTTPIEAVSGTAAAPSYTFSGDTDNGLYYAGTNSIGLSTAGTNAILIDSSRNVGIGTSSPTRPLTVASSTGATNILGVFDNSGTTATNCIIAFSDPTSTGGQFSTRLGSVGDSLAFYTNGANERLRIDSSGRVLVGSTSVGYTGTADNLTLADSSHCGITIRSGSSSSGNIYFSDTTGQAAGTYAGIVMYNHTNNVMQFWTNSVARMLIDSSGNLTFSQEASSNYPEQKLKWSNDSTTTNGFYISQDSSRHGRVWHEQGLDILFGTLNTERMRIDSSGRLIVGRTASVTSGSAADSVVQIVGKKGSPTDLGQLTIARGNSASNLNSGAEIGEIIFSDNAGGNFAQIQCNTDGTSGTNDYPGRLTFHTTADGASSPTECLRINSIGRMTGHAVDVARLFTLLYARLKDHGGCSAGGPGANFTEFDTGEQAFTTVSRTTSSAPSGYQFIGDGFGNAVTFFVGCGDNPVFGTQNKDSAASEYHSWVLVDTQFAAATGGLPLNATRTSLP